MSLWERWHAVVRRSLDGTDLEECHTITGLSSSQLRELFMILQGEPEEGFRIDHIKPRSKWFDETDEAEMKQSFHFSNLQPLTKACNGAKLGLFTSKDAKAWSERTADLAACPTFDDVKRVLVEKGINFGDALWSWRNDPKAPRKPYSNYRKIFAMHSRKHRCM